MVSVLAKEAVRRGYATTAVFPRRAAGRAWLKQLDPDVQRHVIAPSGSRRDLGRLVQRLAALPDAIDLERFRPPTQGRREELRRRYGFRSDEFVALHFGWDWWVKGGDLFVEAAAMLRHGSTNIVCASVRAPESAPGIVRL